jgi:hypothetical protein
MFVDAADYAATRLGDGAARSVVLLEAFSAYFLPQLDQTDAAGMEHLLGILDGVLDPPEQEAVRQLLDEFNVLREESAS